MRYEKRHWPRIWLSLLILFLVVLHSVGVTPLGVLNRLDAIYYDARMRATMPQTLDERIVIVDIDERSLAEFGRWPWSRNKLATLVDMLFTQQQIGLLGFDVVFAESDDSSGLKQLSLLAQQDLRGDADFVTQLNRISPLLNYDGLFAQSLKNRPVVMGYYFTNDRVRHTNGVLPPPVMDGVNLANQNLQFTRWTGYGANIAQLADAAPVAGFFNSLTDMDGVVRSLPLIGELEGKYYESLALAMFRRILGHTSIMPGAVSSASNDSLESIVVRREDQTFSIPVDERASMPVFFRGKGGVSGGSFAYISANDVLAGRLSAGQLRGKIVLLGTTAPGIVDLRVTPVDSVYPGIEVQANALANLLDRKFLIKPHNGVVYEIALLLSLGLALTFALPLLQAPAAMAASIAVLAALIGLNSWLYAAHGVVMPLSSGLFLVVAIFFLNVFYGYLQASRSRRELVQLFGTYVPPELVLEMVKDPDHYTMRAKSDELTVMFCDMRGFTQMSEQLAPLELQKLLNRVFSELTHLIGANRGTVDKYMGDCVMAFWGAPVESPAHAQLAIKTALQMTQALGRINQAQFQGASKASMNISLGIGVNTGQMYVGDMGSDIRRSYTVIGDAVNLASRLEGLSKVYGVSIVVSDATRVLATDFVWQELDLVRVKGKAKAITIYTPLASELTAELSSELMLWQRFLATYRAQDRAQAQTLIVDLLNISPEKPLYVLYAERVAMANGRAVDPLWDGATNFESK